MENEEIEITTSYQQTKIVRPFESAKPYFAVTRKVTVALSQRDFELANEMKKDLALCKRLVKEELKKVEESESTVQNASPNSEKKE